MSGEKWSIECDYMESCNCDFGRACNFSGFPNYGRCETLVGFTSEAAITGTSVWTDWILSMRRRGRGRFTRATEPCESTSPIGHSPSSARLISLPDATTNLGPLCLQHLSCPSNL